MGKFGRTLTLMLVLLTAVSCIGIQDGSDAAGAAPTLGQELIDLMKARDSGAITHEEFKAVKANLIDQYQ